MGIFKLDITFRIQNEITKKFLVISLITYLSKYVMDQIGCYINIYKSFWYWNFLLTKQFQKCNKYFVNN